MMPKAEKCGVTFWADGMGNTFWPRQVLRNGDKTRVASDVATRCFGELVWQVVAYNALRHLIRPMIKIQFYQLN